MNDLKDALSRVADASAPTPIALEQVRGRARQIRRRRTTAALVGSAAAVAVIAGLGVAVLPSGSGHDSVPPATQTPSVTPTTTAKADADEVGAVYDVRLDHLAAEQTFGGDPQVPYWSDGNIIDADGSATPLPDRPLAFAKDTSAPSWIGGTGAPAWVVVRALEAHAEVAWIDAEGRQIGNALPGFAQGLATAPDGQVAVITEQPSGGYTLAVGGRDVPLGKGLSWAEIDGFLPSGDVLLTIDDRVRVAHPATGALTDLPGALQAVSAPSIGLVASGREDGTWRAEAEDGTTRWSLDWAGVSSFSPDARYVALVGDPKHRIPGSADWDSDHATGTIWIRTASDLLPVAAFKAPENGYFWSWTWDGDQLLATVFDRGSGQWSLVRLSPDGFTVGRATAKPGGGEEPAYVFATQ